MEKWRKKIFLATKTDKRDRDGSLKEIEKSLKRLKTDHVDLWQIHHLDTMKEVDQVTKKGGALEALTEMRDQGVVKYLGFTGHEDPNVLVEMSKRFDFDTVLCPVNAGDPNIKPSFIETLLPVAKKQKLGIIGMKVFSQGYIFDVDGLNSSWEAITFALSQSVSTIIVGCDSIGQLEENILIAKAFRQLNKEEQKEISDKTKKYIRKACFFHKNYGGYDSKKELEEL